MQGIASDTQDMTWSDYMAVLRRRWRPSFTAAALIALGSIYIAYTLPAIYESSATILIEQQGVPTDFVQTTVNSYAEELLQTIYQRVVAAPKIADLIERHDLYPKERLVSPDEDVYMLFRDSTSMSPKNVTTVHARTGRESIVTFGLQIAFTYPDPVKARDVAKELSDLFVSHNAAIRTETAARTTAFLDSEAVELQKKLSEVEANIAALKERHANNLPEDQEVNLETWERLRGQMTEVENQIRTTRERKALLETELAETPPYRPVTGESGDPVFGGVDRLAQAQQELIRLRGRYSDNHPEITNLRREIAALSASPVNRAHLMPRLLSELQSKHQELAAARETYSENHPDVARLQRTVRSLEEQIENLEREIATSASAQPNNPVYLQLRTRINSAEVELADLARQRYGLTERVQELEQRRLVSPQVELEYRELTNEQELLFAQYRGLRGLESEAALGEALETGQSGERLTIIEPARVPANPISPDRVSLTFLGFVLALAVGLGIAALTEAADSKVRGQRDVYRLLEMPPIGVIPYIEDTQDKLKRRTLNATIGAALVGATTFVIMTVLN